MSRDQRYELVDGFVPGRRIEGLMVINPYAVHRITS
jgi:hypothetical protein